MSDLNLRYGNTAQNQFSRKLNFPWFLLDQPDFKHNWAQILILNSRSHTITQLPEQKSTFSRTVTRVHSSRSWALRWARAENAHEPSNERPWAWAVQPYSWAEIFEKQHEQCQNDEKNNSLWKSYLGSGTKFQKTGTVIGSWFESLSNETIPTKIGRKLWD